MDEVWYNQDDPGRAVLELGRELWKKQGAQRISLAEDSLALYTGSTRHSLLHGGNPLALLDLISNEAASENIIQSIVDTKVNSTVRNKVRPLFVTEGGDSTLKQQQEDMQSAVDGIMSDLGCYGMGAQVNLALIACFCGFIFEGVGIEWYADLANSRVVGTPVWCWEYMVSAREARSGNPRQMFARHAIDRAVLLSYMQDAPAAVRQAIESADAATWRDTADDTKDPKKLNDQVIVYKAWHLPSGRVDFDDPRSFGKNDDGGRYRGNPVHDGRHVVVLDGVTESISLDPAIVDAAWPHDHFPVSWFKPFPVVGSYWSRGVPEIIAKIQIEINRWNMRENKIMDLHSRPLIFLDKTLGVNPAMITNASGNIIQTTGSPQGRVWQMNIPAVPSDLLSRVARLTQAAKDQLGMSDLAMTAKKPAGVNHEPGLAFLADTESVRHTVENDAWADFSLDNAKNIVRCLNDLAEYDPEYEIIFANDKQLRRGNWAKMRLDNPYQIKRWPTNFLKQSPAQRADQISDLVDKGALPPEAMLAAIDAPDLQSFVSDAAAMEKCVSMVLDRIIQKGYDSMKDFPSPYLDLQTCKRLGIQRLAELQANDDDWKKQNDVTRYLEDVDAVIAKITPSPSPNAPTAGNQLGAMGPTGAPSPAPLKGPV